jgi:hypothetical protein
MSKPQDVQPEIIVRHDFQAGEAVSYFFFETGATAVEQDRFPDGSCDWFTLAGFGPGGPPARPAGEAGGFSWGADGDLRAGTEARGRMADATLHRTGGINGRKAWSPWRTEPAW